MLKNVLLQYKKTVLFYMGNSIVQIFTASLSVVYFQKLIDVIPMAKNTSAIFAVFVFYGIFLVLDCVLLYIDEYPHRLLSEGIYQKLKLQALEKVSRIDYASYKDIGTGQLVKLVENGADAGRRILFDFFLNIFRNLLPGAVISLFFIGTYDLRVMAAIAAGYILVFVITSLLLKYLYKVKNSILAHEEWLSKYSVRGFMELVVFRVNKRFRKEIEKINDRSGRIVEAQTKVRMIHELFLRCLL